MGCIVHIHIYHLVIHTWDLLGMNYSLNNGLYCTKGSFTPEIY